MLQISALRTTLTEIKAQIDLFQHSLSKTVKIADWICQIHKKIEWFTLFYTMILYT